MNVILNTLNVLIINQRILTHGVEFVTFDINCYYQSEDFCTKLITKEGRVNRWSSHPLNIVVSTVSCIFCILLRITCILHPFARLNFFRNVSKFIVQSLLLLFQRNNTKRKQITGCSSLAWTLKIAETRIFIQLDKFTRSICESTNSFFTRYIPPLPRREFLSILLKGIVGITVMVTILLNGNHWYISDICRQAGLEGLNRGLLGWTTT